MPGYVNGIPHATSTDRIDLWPTTSRNIAQWVDENVPRNDDPRLTNARPPTTHTHDLGDVDGLQAALDGKTDTTDPRLSDARPPTAHTHEITDVDGLKAIIDRLTYDSGWRDVTSLLSPDYLALNPDSTVYISRIGNEVTMNFSQGAGATASGLHSVVLTLPSGFRTTGQARPWGSTGLDVQTGKQVIDSAGLYLDAAGWRVNLNATPGKRYSFTMRWTTHEDPPTSPPGTPA